MVGRGIDEAMAYKTFGIWPNCFSSSPQPCPEGKSHMPPIPGLTKRQLLIPLTALRVNYMLKDRMKLSDEFHLELTVGLYREHKIWKWAERTLFQWFRAW